MIREAVHRFLGDVSPAPEPPSRPAAMVPAAALPTPSPRADVPSDLFDSGASWAEIGSNYAARRADHEAKRDGAIADAQAAFNAAKSEAQSECAAQVGELDSQLEQLRAERHEGLRIGVARELSMRLRAFLEASYQSDVRRFVLEFGACWRSLQGIAQRELGGRLSRQMLAAMCAKALGVVVALDSGATGSRPIDVAFRLMQLLEDQQSATSDIVTGLEALIRSLRRSGPGDGELLEIACAELFDDRIRTATAELAMKRAEQHRRNYQPALGAITSVDGGASWSDGVGPALYAETIR